MRVRLVSLVLLAAAMLSGVICVAVSYSSEKIATPVGKCFDLLIEAYGNRDIDALDDLLAEEFRAEDGVNSWDKEKEVEIAGALFKNASGVTLSIDDGYKVSEVGPGHWKVTELTSLLTVIDNGKEFNVSIPGGEYEIREGKDGSLKILRRLLPSE